jgi:hypothetical protein
MLLVFLVYYSRIHLMLKLITLPLAIMLSGLVTLNYLDNLGAPLGRELPAEIEYMHHEVQGKLVFVWIKTDDRGNRIHVIPYERNQVKALEEAKKKKEQQKGVKVKVKKKGNKQNNGNEKPMFEIKVERPVSGQGETK